MKLKFTIDNLIIGCLYLIFITTSYLLYMPSRILDDIIIIFLGFLVLYKILKKRKISFKLSIILLLLVIEYVWEFISIIDNLNDGFVSFFTFNKILIILLIAFDLNYDQEQINNILKNLFLISIPNLIIGGIEIYKAYIKGIALEGKYEIINNVKYYRIQGATGHPIYYSFLMVGLLLYFLYNSKSKYKNVMVIICFILCIATYSSFTITLSLSLILFKLFLKNKYILSAMQKHSMSCSIIAIIVSLIVLYKFMLKEAVAIRYISTVNTISNIGFNNFLLGNGFGSYLAANYAEAYIFRIIYENGLVGLILFMVILLSLITYQMKVKNYSGVFIVFAYLLNIFINEGYMVPYIVFIPIFCNQIKEYKVKYTTNKEDSLLKMNGEMKI